MSTELRRRPRLVAAVVLIVTFVCGAVAGVVTAPLVLPPPGAGPPLLPFGGIGLSAEQEARGRQIIERHRPEIDAILSEAAPKVNAVRERIAAELATVLTPEQQVELRELEKRRRPPGAPDLGPPPPWPPR